MVVRKERKVPRKTHFLAQLLLCMSCFLLSGCSEDPSVIGSLQGKVILTSDALAQEAKKAMPIVHPQDIEAFYEKVAWMLMTESLIEADQELPVEGDSYAEAMRAQAIERYGGEEGLLRQLEHFGLTSEEFMDSLRREGKRKAHRNAYLSAHPVSDEQVRDYVKKHTDECALLTYTEIQLPTLSETKKVVSILRENPAEAADYENVLNSDLFDTTSYARRMDIRLDDPIVRDEDIFHQELGSVDYYYLSDTQTYWVIWVEGRKDTYADVAENARQRLDNDRYLEELNRLAKKYDLRFHADRIAPLLKEQESTSSDE